MKASSARARLASAAKLARTAGLAPDRGARFDARGGDRGGDRAVTLDELRVWPRWPREPELEQSRIFGVTALRASHDALGEVISGDVLRGYAAAVGEDLLEAVLAKPGQGSAPLPRAEALIPAGRTHAYRALPPRLARALGADAGHDPAAVHHVTEAEALVALDPLAGGVA